MPSHLTISPVSISIAKPNPLYAYHLCSDSIPPVMSLGKNETEKPCMQRMNTEFKRFKTIVKTVADAFANPSLSFFLQSDLKDALTETSMYSIYRL